MDLSHGVPCIWAPAFAGELASFKSVVIPAEAGIHSGWRLRKVTMSGANSSPPARG
jgi:hypothetical protein